MFTTPSFASPRNFIAHGVLALLCCGLVAPQAPAQVHWRTGAAPHSGKDQAQIVQTLAGASARGADRHLMVQFDRPLSLAERDQLAAAGLRLLSYLSDGAYFAAVDSRIDAARLGQMQVLKDAQTIQRTWKLHPVLARGDKPDWAAVPAPQGATESDGDWIGAYVLFHQDVTAEAAAAIAVRHNLVVRHQLETVNGMVVELPLSGVEAFAAEDGVQYLEPALPKMSGVNDSNRQISQADIVQAAPYNLNGSGVTVLVYDGGTALDLHPDFEGRLFVRDGSGVADHATHVSGTIGGAGTASGGLLRGMAPGVTIQSYGFEYDGSGIFLYTNPGDTEADYAQAINTYGADIANNSIGTNTAANGFSCEIEGDYGIMETVIDSIVRGGLGAPFRVVWANGNERGNGRCGTSYHTTAPPACAKNHITVGAMNSNDDSVTSFTSWGPLDDGRLKPDVSAPGCQSDGDLGVTSCAATTVYTSFCGTSMASPTVCGISALLLQDFRAQVPGQPDFRNSTLKVLLAHTAEDLQNTGPDYQTGYGSVRAQRAVDFMRTGQFFEDDAEQGGVLARVVVVDAGTPQLKFTLAWDDVPGTPNVNPALVNDLDLRVFDPAGVQHFPWTLDPASPAADAVRIKADHVNNIEQVVVDAPSAGTWRVEVHGYDVPDGPQVFSIAYSHPLLVCASGGSVSFDRSVYACDDSARIKVVDCDLNADGGAVETASVVVASDSQPAGQTVLLTETGPDTAEFTGELAFSSEAGSGALQVAHGDALTATYVDTDDGRGGSNVPVTAPASVDCQGPIISNVRVTSVGLETARISFDTSEPASAVVHFGLDCESLTGSADSSSSLTAHEAALGGLTENTKYFFAIEAADGSGNTDTDNAAGACYSFVTAEAIHDFPMEANPGWTVQGQWAFGVPAGGGSSNRDPTSGFTGASVFGYNLNGDYANNLPATYLTSGPMNCTGITDVKLLFQRWLGVESNSAFDEATVEVSNDGSTWTVIWRATVDGGGLDVSDASWQPQEFDISAIADDRPAVQVRWGMGPTDTSVTFPGWNIDDVRLAGQRRRLAIRFPDGLPAALTPGEFTTITVEISDGTETYVPGSGRLHHRYHGGAFISSVLSPLGGNLYQATLPPTHCGSTPEFYFSAQGSGGTTLTSPPAAPADVYTAVMGTIFEFHEDFEVDRGWTVGDVDDDALTGQWERVDPNGTAAQPEDDVTPPPGTTCFVTGQDLPGGVAPGIDVDNGKTTLTSPVFDLAGTRDAEVSYWRWYSNDTGAVPNTDVFLVHISNDGGATWTLVEEVGPGGVEASAGWRYHEFAVEGFVPLTSQMRMRFIASDEGEGSFVEAALDEFRVTARTCENVGVPAATITSAVTRKANPGGPGGLCDIALQPGVRSEPRIGGVTEVRVAFDIPPGQPAGSPVSIEEKVCPPPGSYAPYSGTSTSSATVEGNALVVGFTPALENGRTYRLSLAADVSSIPGQFVELRGLSGDVDGNGQVNAVDRSTIVGVWTGSGFSCSSDLNSDGSTNAVDRSVAVGAWTGSQNCAP